MQTNNINNLHEDYSSDIVKLIISEIGNYKTLSD